MKTKQEKIIPVKHVNIEIEFIDKVGDYGYLVSKKTNRKGIDIEGNIRNVQEEQFNVLLKDGTYSSENWFDTYKLVNEDNIIIGYEKSYSDYEKIENLKIYFEYGKLKDKYRFNYGAIHKGKCTVNPIYDYLEYANENSYKALYMSNYGYVDAVSGMQLTPLVLDNGCPFNNGSALVTYKGKVGCIKRNSIIKDLNDEEQFEESKQEEKVMKKELSKRTKILRLG